MAGGDVIGGGAWTLAWRQNNGTAGGHSSTEWGIKLAHILLFLLNTETSQTWHAGEPCGECGRRFQPPPPLLHQPDQHEAERQQQGQLP